MLNDFEVFKQLAVRKVKAGNDSSICTLVNLYDVYYGLSMCHCKQCLIGCMALSAEVEKPKNWNRVWGTQPI